MRTSITISPLYLLVGGLVFGLLAMRTWTRKGGSPVLGFVLGFFLGLIGWLIVALMRGPGYRAPAAYQPPDGTSWESSNLGVPLPERVAMDRRWMCPYCAQLVLQDAHVCSACGRELPLRACPHCNYNTLATSETCGACLKRSEGWKLHNGHWWKREDGVVYVYDAAQQSWKPQA
jgi:hypothetical protein